MSVCTQRTRWGWQVAVQGQEKRHTRTAGWQMAVQGQEKRRTTTVWRKPQRPQTEADRWPYKAKRNDERWAGRWPPKAKTNYEWRRKGSRRFPFFFSGYGRHVKTSLPTRNRQAGTRRGLACWREFEYFGKSQRQFHLSQEELSNQN